MRLTFLWNREKKNRKKTKNIVVCQQCPYLDTFFFLFYIIIYSFSQPQLRLLIPGQLIVPKKDGALHFKICSQFILHILKEHKKRKRKPITNLSARANFPTADWLMLLCWYLKCEALSPSLSTCIWIMYPSELVSFSHHAVQLLLLLLFLLYIDFSLHKLFIHIYLIFIPKRRGTGRSPFFFFFHSFFSSSSPI